MNTVRYSQIYRIIMDFLPTPSGGPAYGIPVCAEGQRSEPSDGDASRHRTSRQDEPAGASEDQVFG